MKMRRGQSQFVFVGLILTGIGLVIFTVMYPMLDAIMSPVIATMPNDLLKIEFQLALGLVFFGILGAFFFIASPAR